MLNSPRARDVRSLVRARMKSLIKSRHRLMLRIIRLMLRIIRLMLRITVVTLAIGISALSRADVEGASDVRGLARFPNSEIVRFVRYPAGASFAYPLSDLDKLRGELRGRRLLRLVGERTSITYRVNAGYSADEVAAHFERQLSYRGADRYSCRALDCGSSTLWANDVFGVSMLYGSDGSQSYLATPARLAGTPLRLAVYVVERGNHQVFAQIEAIADGASAPTATASWRVIALPSTPGAALSLQIDMTRLTVMRTALRAAQPTEALVVCYLDAPRPLSELVGASSRCAAQAVRAIAASAPGVRLIPVGAGADAHPARLELVFRAAPAH